MSINVFDAKHGDFFTITGDRFVFEENLIDCVSLVYAPPLTEMPKHRVKNKSSSYRVVHIRDVDGKAWMTRLALHTLLMSDGFKIW